jgi:hypothetical protein
MNFLMAAIGHHKPVPMAIGSGVASPTTWSCYANIDRENNQFLKK